MLDTIRLEDLDTLGATVGWLSKEKELHINLRNKQLRGTLPASWSQLTQLQTLDLSNNNLTGTLPAQWSTLHDLYDLDLANNRNLRGTVPEAWSVIVDYSAMGVDVDISFTYAACAEKEKQKKNNNLYGVSIWLKIDAKVGDVDCNSKPPPVVNSAVARSFMLPIMMTFLLAVFKWW